MSKLFVCFVGYLICLSLFLVNGNKMDVYGTQERTSQSYRSSFPLININREIIDELDNAAMQV